MDKCRKRKEQSRAFFQRHKKELCDYTIHTGCIRAIERDKKKAAVEAEQLMIKYPYEDFQSYFKYTIKKYGVYEGKYAWQECIEATYFAYLYSLYRCAAQGYTYVSAYVRKVGRIFVCCAVIISSEEMRRSSWDEDFERKNY